MNNLSMLIGLSEISVTAVIPQAPGNMQIYTLYIYIFSTLLSVRYMDYGAGKWRNEGR